MVGSISRSFSLILILDYIVICNDYCNWHFFYIIPFNVNPFEAIYSSE